MYGPHRGLLHWNLSCSFTLKILLMRKAVWSQVPYKCPTCRKHMFCTWNMCFFSPQNMCFPHGRHVWGMWDHHQSISEGKLSLIIPLSTPKTQILTKVMFFGCKNTYFKCKNRWIMGKKHVFSTWRTHVGNLRPSPINFWWKTTPKNTSPKVKNSKPDKRPIFFGTPCSCR